MKFNKMSALGKAYLRINIDNSSLIFLSKKSLFNRLSICTSSVGKKYLIVRFLTSTFNFINIDFIDASFIIDIYFINWVICVET